MIFYIHGFNSGKDSSTGKLLEAQVGRPVCRLQYDCSKPFKDNLEALTDEIWKKSDCFDVVVGCSLGGFYAIEAANVLQFCAVVFNPAMKPRTQLRQFLGENVNFATGEKWIFTEDVLNTYPDELKAPSHLPIKAYASFKDEVLPGNAEIAKNEFKLFEPIDSGHRITDFSKYVDLITAYENILGISPDE